MKTKEEWPSLTMDEIENEIHIRAKLHGEMVGTLYPSILLNEIAQLGHLKAYKRGLTTEKTNG